MHLDRRAGADYIAYSAPKPVVFLAFANDYGGTVGYLREEARRLHREDALGQGHWSAARSGKFLGEPFLWAFRRVAWARCACIAYLILLKTCARG